MDWHRLCYQPLAMNVGYWVMVMKRALGLVCIGSSIFVLPSIEAQTRIFGTWYGGTGYDFVERNGVALTSDGGVVLAGNTQSTQGIATPATHKTQMTNINFRDAFVVRFNAQGVRQCATYFGGDSDELAMDIVLNEQGDVYIVGATASNWPSDAIATPGSAQGVFGGGKFDAFMVKLDKNCRRVAGTYFGGPGQNGDGAYGIALGRDGIYITGWTDSASGIARGGAHQSMLRGGYDAFLVKLSLLNHQVIWATYYGGEGYDVAHAVKVAEDGHVYIAGITTSSEHIALNGGHQENLAGGMDLFVAKFHPFNGQVVGGTYIGGERNEGTMNHVALALSKNGYLYVLCDTYSSTGIATVDAPVQSRGGQSDLDLLDLFLVKLKQADLKRIWGTYLGFKNVEGPAVMALGSDDSIYIGVATSGVEEATEYTFQTTIGYGLLAKYQGENAHLQWLTFFDAPIRGIDVNASHEIAIAGAHNTTVTRSGLPLNIASENAHQKDMLGNMDAFVVKFSNQSPPPRIVAPDQVTGYVGQAIKPVQFKNNSGRPNRWNAVGLPEGLLINTTQGTVTGTPQKSGIYNVLITAENDQGTSRFTSIFKIYARPELKGPEAVIVKVNQAMAPIVAINVGGQPDEWILRDKPSWMEFDPRTGQINGIPTEIGTYTVYLTARNPVGESIQKIDFIVESATPVITSSLAATGVQGNSFTYLLETENTTSIEVKNLPPNLAFDAATRTISGLPIVAGNYPITLIASNATTSVEKTLNLTILPQPPAITSPTVWNIPQNQSVNFTITTTPQADKISAQGLPEGLSINQHTGLIQGIVSNTGTFPVNITAQNQGGQSTQTLTIQVTAAQTASTAPTAPPRITTPDTINGILGSAFGFAINTEGQVTRYDAQGLPLGLSVSPNTGYILGVPEQVGTFEVKLIATNQAGTTTKNLTITIANQTLAIISTPSPMTAPPNNFSLPTPLNNLTSTTPPLRFPLTPTTSTPSTPSASSLASQPPTSASSSSPLSSSPKPPKNSTPTQSTTPRATPKKSSSEEPSTSAPSQNAPNSTTPSSQNKSPSTTPLHPAETVQIITPSTASGLVGQNFYYAIRAQGTPTSYAVHGTLPEGLQFNETAGIISGTPTASGTFNVTIQASNGKANSAKALIITITAPPAPIITSETTQRGYLDTPFEYQIRASGNPTSYKIDGALPEGLTFDPKKGRITGTPQKETRNQIKMIAIGAGGRDEKNLLIQIFKAPAPQIKTISSLSAEINTPFEQKIEADQEPKTFLIEGTLPEGIEFDKNKGILSGIPKKEGTYAFEIKAVNETGTGAKKFTLRVTPQRIPMITTAKTARGTIDRPFRYQIRANFQADQYAIIGDLPSGLQLDSKTGIIQGRPQSSGNFTIKIQAIKENQKAESDLTLIIEENNSQPIRYRPSPDDLNELVSDQKPSIAILIKH